MKLKKDFSVVHCVARCKDCDWYTESYKNGQAISAKHARRYGHKVVVDIGIAGEYDGRDLKVKHGIRSR